jgi:hypothetical protein
LNRTAQRITSSVTAAGAGLLLSAAVFGLAPAALADDGPHPLELSLSAPAPAEIGLAGQPVEYSDTVTNTGAAATDELVMRFTLDGGQGLPSNAASLEYRTAGGVWKPVPLDFAGTTFSGTLPGTFTLGAGASRTVRLRVGLPMGTPHNGDSNGGTQSLKVHTTVSRAAAGAAAVVDDHTIAVSAATASLSGVPAFATAGDAGITFDAKVSNPTASAYENLSHILVTDTHTIVEVRRSGGWTRLPAVMAPIGPGETGRAVYTLDGKDSSIGAHTETVTKVRLSYPRSAGGAKSIFSDCLLVNAGANPLSGTTFCDKQTTIPVRVAATGGTSPTAVPTATPTTSTTTAASPATPAAIPAPARSATPDTSGQLAKTGSGSASAMAAGAGALLLAGAAVVGAAAHRRRASR